MHQLTCSRHCSPCPAEREKKDRFRVEVTKSNKAVQDTVFSCYLLAADFSIVQGLVVLLGTDELPVNLLDTDEPELPVNMNGFTPAPMLPIG